MISNVVAELEMQRAARELIAVTPDWLDTPPKVRLVTVPFVPNNSGTYPAVSPVVPFLVGTTGAPWELQYDAVEGDWKVVAPEPVGGWDFVSTDAGDSIVGFTVENAASNNWIGGNMFETPIPVTDAGQHIMLPNFSLPLADLLASAATPYALE